jgi:hypothetical protein
MTSITLSPAGRSRRAVSSRSTVTRTRGPAGVHDFALAHARLREFRRSGHQYMERGEKLLDWARRRTAAR